MTSKKRASLVFPISWAFFTLSIYNRISFSHIIKGFALFIFIFLATPALASTQELVVNGDFEDGTSGWTLSGAVVTSGGNQHAGTRYAVLGEINSSTDILSQIMTVPTNAGLATASFYYYIYTEEASTGEYDTLEVDLINLTTDTTYSIAHLSNLDGGTCTSGSSCYEYLSKQIDLTGMDGDSIQIRFRSTLDSSVFTSFKIDDVSLLVNIADEESVSAPTAVTDSATNITSSAATLNGTVNPNGLSTEVNFRWRKPDQDANPTNLYQDIGDGTSPVSVSTEISGLDPSTQYEFQVYAVNAINGSFGDWNTFTTSATTQPQCSDGIDNDGDGLIDYPNDPDCTDSNDTSEQGSFGGDTLDIEVSDGPDPFTPANGEINTITVSNVGTMDCDLTLTIENAVEESPLTTLAHGTTMDFPWDGRNSGGDLVPAGDYTYTAECAQTRNSTAQSWWGKVFAWFTNTAHAFFSDTETGTITVLASGEPQSPTCDLFTANPTTITKGESTTLTWESSNAVDADIDNGIGSVSVDGSTTVQPQQTTTYTATFTGESDGVAMCSVEVIVIEPVDTDGDCVVDSEERTIGTNPNDADTDGDGLWDGWEINNKDMENSCNQLDFDLVGAGANPRHKDIFLEVDWQQNYKPEDVAIDKIVQAFDSAPVQNADGSTGITLHVDVSNQIPPDQIGAITSFSPLDVLGGGRSDFDTIKSKNFDSARKPFFHYALFANTFSIGVLAKPETTGIAEMPGNDLMVTINSLSETAFSPDVSKADMQALTLMHELGHNLDLKHGGEDSKQYKPNYVSVMNYWFQGFGGITDGSTVTRRLDYSTNILSTLDEDDLNEFAGISNNTDESYFYCPDGSPRRVNNDQPVDWNCNGVLELNVHSNINGNAFSPFELLETTLEGFNDWGHIQYNFREDGSYADGVRGHIADPDKEYSTIIAEERGLNLSYHDVKIDVRPLNPTNVVNLNEKRLPVAVLSDEYVDATKIIPETVSMFGGKPVEKIHLRDINRDGKLDAVLTFDVSAFTFISPKSEYASVSGKTTDGIYFVGTDTIKIVPQTEN